MSLELLNFASWYVQVTIVAAAGLAVVWSALAAAPKVRLAYLHLLLAACVVLPLVQPYRRSLVVIPADVSVAVGPAIIAQGERAPARPWTVAEAVAVALVSGTLVRLAWLGFGLLRLRRYRRNAERLLPLTDEARQVIHRLGVHAELYVSEDVTSPVTFGLMNPAVLLPPGFLELPAEKREPVILHELLHVKRYDWGFALGEEIVRSLMWFHPAVWWLLGRIQLTREQAVDQEVVEQTREPEHYVDALIAIASTRLEADLAPAPLFLKKRHLRQRVASIVQGVTMSKRDLLLTSIAVFSSLPLVVGLTAWQFPLNAAPQEVQDSQGVEVKTGAYRLLHRTPVYFPPAARERGISGAVTATVTVNAKGDVTDARVVSGPEELRKAVLTSLLEWHFAAEGGPKTFDVSVEFSSPKAGPPPGARKEVLPRVQTPQQTLTVARVDTGSLSPALQERVSRLNLPREGEVLTAERLARVAEELSAIDEHLVMGRMVRDGKATLAITLRGAASAAAFPGGGVLPTDAPGRIKVGGDAQAMKIVSKVMPKYPSEAKQARVQGTVRMNVVIDKQGNVSNIQLLSGHPLLVPPAVDAVKQWVYQPTLLNGNPVEVMTTVDVNFTLSDAPPPPPPPPPPGQSQ